MMDNLGATRRFFRGLVSFFFVLLPAFVFGSSDATDPKTVKDSKESPPIEKSWCETPPALEIRVGVPGWLAGLSGETGVRGITSDVDVSFDQLVRHLTHFPIALMADLRYQ